MKFLRKDKSDVYKKPAVLNEVLLNCLTKLSVNVYQNTRPLFTVLGTVLPILSPFPQLHRLSFVPSVYNIIDIFCLLSG